MYLNSQCSQKEIAKEVGVNENTIGRWVAAEKWDLLKNEVGANNESLIASLTKQLNKLIADGIKALEDDDPKTNPDTQAQIMTAKAIHYLRTKTGTGQMYETGMAFLGYLQKENPELAKLVAPVFHAFIKSNL